MTPDPDDVKMHHKKQFCLKTVYLQADSCFENIWIYAKDSTQFSHVDVVWWKTWMQPLLDVRDVSSVLKTPLMVISLNRVWILSPGC